MESRTVQRLRGVVQIVVPFAVGLDTLHSFYRVHQLALERLKDWEEEAATDVVRSVAPQLARLGTRCARTDPDFWPSEVARRLPAAAEAEAGDANGTSRTGVEYVTLADAAGDAWTALVGRAEAPGPDGAPRQTAGLVDALNVPRPSERLEVVTLGDAVDAWVGALEARVPLPTLEVERRSALRGWVRWRGVRWPGQGAGGDLSLGLVPPRSEQAYQHGHGQRRGLGTAAAASAVAVSTDDGSPADAYRRGSARSDDLSLSLSGSSVDLSGPPSFPGESSALGDEYVGSPSPSAISPGASPWGSSTSLSPYSSTTLLGDLAAAEAPTCHTPRGPFHSSSFPHSCSDPGHLEATEPTIVVA